MASVIQSSSLLQDYGTKMDSYLQYGKVNLSYQTKGAVMSACVLLCWQHAQLQADNYTGPSRLKYHVHRERP